MKSKLIVLLLSLSLLTPTFIPVNSYADTKPTTKVTMVKPTTKPPVKTKAQLEKEKKDKIAKEIQFNKDICKIQDKSHVENLNTLDEYQSILIEMYVYGEIYEGDYTLLMEYISQIRSAIHQSRDLAKTKNTPLKTEQMDIINDAVLQLMQVVQDYM